MRAEAKAEVRRGTDGTDGTDEGGAGRAPGAVPGFAAFSEGKSGMTIRRD